MTRKPDEIMRELKDPIHVHYHHGDREPYMTPIAMVDLEQLHADALALIQRLDRTIVDQEKLAKKIYDQKVEAEERIQQLQDDNAQKARCIENMTDKLNAMNDEVAKLQAERDAAVNDLKTVCNMMNICSMCKDHAEGSERCEGSGMSSNWEWRGATKEG